MNLNILKAAWFTPVGRRVALNDGNPEIVWGLVLNYEGPPGVGKTARIRQESRRAGLHMHRLSAASGGAGAFGATPVPEDGHITYPLPEWVTDFQAHESRGVLFLDEIQFAAGKPDIEPALMSLLDERVIGNERIPGGVRIAAACNSAAISGGLEMLEALENRMGWINVPFDFDAFHNWLQHAHNGETQPEVDPAKLEAEVLALWQPAYQNALKQVGMFLKTHQHLACVDKEQPEWAGKKSRPTPRTWEYAARAMAASKIHGLTEVETASFVAAFIGVETEAQFAAYIESLGLPTAREVLSGMWRHNPQRLDVTAIVLANVTAYLRNGSQNPDDDAEAFWTILNDLIDAGVSDLVVPIGGVLVGMGLDSNTTMQEKLSEKVMGRTRDMSEAVKKATTAKR